MGISPSIDDNKLDLPEPMTPQAAIHIPLTTLRYIPDSVGVGEYGFHENLPVQLITGVHSQTKKNVSQCSIHSIGKILLVGKDKQHNIT